MKSRPFFRKRFFGVRSESGPGPGVKKRREGNRPAKRDLSPLRTALFARPIAPFVYSKAPDQERGDDTQKNEILGRGDFY